MERGQNRPGLGTPAAALQSTNDRDDAWVERLETATIGKVVRDLSTPRLRLW
jgi:hypothetical protein